MDKNTLAFLAFLCNKEPSLCYNALGLLAAPALICADNPRIGSAVAVCIGFNGVS
jgi:hypothetical protein